MDLKHATAPRQLRKSLFLKHQGPKKIKVNEKKNSSSKFERETSKIKDMEE